MQIGVRMGHIPASRRTVTMAIAVIAVITLSIAMLLFTFAFILIYKKVTGAKNLGGIR